MDKEDLLEKLKSVMGQKAATVEDIKMVAKAEPDIYGCIDSLKKNAQRFERVTNEYKRQRNDLEVEKKRIQESLQSLYKGIIEKDLEEMSDLVDAAKRLNAELAYGKGAQIYKVFDAVFRNMTSKTIDVTVKKPGGPIITVGKFGFGLKYHLVSRRVESIEGMKSVMANREEISKALREFSHLKKWADKLDKFAEIMPGDWIYSSPNVEIMLKDPILIPQYTDFETARKLTVVYTTGYRQELKAFLALVFDDGRGENRRTDRFDIELGKESFDTSLVYIQLRDELKRIKPQIIEMIDKQIVTANDSVGKLTGAFMKEVMMADV